jgi:hypothetical protein
MSDSEMITGTYISHKRRPHDSTDRLEPITLEEEDLVETMSTLIENLKIVSPIPSKACPILDENYVIWLDTAFNIINIQPHSKFEKEEEGDTTVSSEKAGIQLKRFVSQEDKPKNELIYYYEEAITTKGIPIHLARRFKDIAGDIDDQARLKTDISRFNPAHFKILFDTLIKQTPPTPNQRDDDYRFGVKFPSLGFKVKIKAPTVPYKENQIRLRRIKYYFHVIKKSEQEDELPRPINHLVLGVNSDTEIESVKIDGDQILSTRGNVYRNSHWRDIMQEILRCVIEGGGIQLGGVGELMVHPLAFKLSPELVLNKYTFNNINYIIYSDDNFEPQPGIDAGGLTKQFLHDLFENLFDGSKDRCIKIEESEDGGMPYIDLGSEKNEANGIKAAKNIGNIFSKIYIHPHFTMRKISMGRFLPDNFFHILIDVLSIDGTYPGENFVKSVSRYALSPAFTPLLNYSIHHVSEKAKCLEILEQSCIELTDEEKNDKTALQRRIFIFLREKIDPYVVFASGVIEGMTDRVMQMMARESPQAISKILQGDLLDPKDVISRIRLLPEYLGENSHNFEVVLLKIEYLKRYIIDVADTKWLQRFLLCTTGQKNLSCSSIINILPTGGVMCSAHTCTNTLEIPNTFNTPPFDEPNQRERFLQNLELCLSCVDGGFENL